MMKALKYSILFTITLWIIYFIINIFHIDVTYLGIIPRSFNNIIGIATSPLIHRDFYHILSNTTSFFLISLIYFYLYKKWGTFIYLWLGSGLILWVIGREGSHIGISGVIYALFTYVILMGFFKKEIKTILISILLIIFYNGMIYGILPTDSLVSWEGHLSGIIAGIIISIREKNCLIDKKKVSL